MPRTRFWAVSARRSQRFFAANTNRASRPTSTAATTADKFNTREYLRYTGYPGGQRSYTPADLMAKSKLKTIKPGKHPLFIKVVKGMLPKGPLGARLLNNMYVYNSAEHPFQDVDAKVIDINKLK